MLEKNYTNAEGKGRFGFSESGTYRAPYKAEPLLIIIFIALFVVILGAGAVLAYIFVRKMILESTENASPMLWGIVGVIIFAACAALGYAVAAVGLSYVRKGFGCTYSATDDRFTANIGGDTEIIFYSDVHAVKFSPKSVLGKVCGYDVYITVGSDIRKFGVAFAGKFQTEKTTPFYIIKERMELAEQRRCMETVKLHDLKNNYFQDSISQEQVEEARQKRKTVEQRVEKVMTDCIPDDRLIAEHAEAFLKGAGDGMSSIAPRKDIERKAAPAAEVVDEASAMEAVTTSKPSDVLGKAERRESAPASSFAQSDMPEISKKKPPMNL